MLLCHHGCGSESAFDHCSYFFSLFTTHSKNKVVNRLACEQALHLGKTREVTRGPHAKARRRVCEEPGFAARSRVLSCLALTSLLEGSE